MHSEVTYDPQGLEELDLICELYGKSESEKNRGVVFPQKNFAGMSAGSTDIELKLGDIPDFKYKQINK